MARQDLDTIQHPSGGATELSQWGGQVNDNDNFMYGDAAYIAPTLANGWVNFGGGFNNAGYRKVGTEVRLRGLLKSGTVGNVAMFVLPVGYRPTSSCVLSVASNNGAVNVLAECRIDTVGNVIPISGSNGYYSIDGLRFDTI